MTSFHKHLLPRNIDGFLVRFSIVIKVYIHTRKFCLMFCPKFDRKQFSWGFWVKNFDVLLLGWISNKTYKTRGFVWNWAAGSNTTKPRGKLLVWKTFNQNSLLWRFVMISDVIESFIYKVGRVFPMSIRIPVVFRRRQWGVRRHFIRGRLGWNENQAQRRSQSWSLRHVCNCLVILHGRFHWFALTCLHSN